MSITTDVVICLGIKEMSQGKQLLRAFVDYANNRNVYKEEGYHSLDDYFKGRVEGIKSDTLYGRDGYSNVRYSYIGKMMVLKTGTTVRFLATKDGVICLEIK